MTRSEGADRHPAAAGPPRIAAVVVTFNRLALLKQCVEALRGQTRRPDGILVVNNGSTDGTDEWLAAQPDLAAIRQANLGSGGGQHMGIREALARGFDWVWCMDDDGRPAPDALQALADTITADSEWLNSLVVDTADPQRLTFGIWHGGHWVWSVAEARSISGPIAYANPFNGTLLSRRLVERIGLPHPDLFIWGEETEYARRAASAGCKSATVADSTFFHPRADFESLVRNNDLRRFGRFYYLVRNTGARTEECGERLCFSGRAAFGAARSIGRITLRDLWRSPWTTLGKWRILASAVLAAARNDSRRRYL